MDLSKQKFMSRDFSGQDLRNVNMSHSEFICCNFNDADMSGVDASHSVFAGGSMKGTKCTNTNFAHSELNIYFFPRDAMGTTWTLNCRTFTGMSISKMWWFGWIYFAMQMTPELDDGKDLRDSIIKAMGSDRYIRLSNLFKKRQI